MGLLFNDWDKDGHYGFSDQIWDFLLFETLTSDLNHEDDDDCEQSHWYDEDEEDDGLL